ncbi:unnamed protein product [Diamesa serratosioi]
MVSPCPYLGKFYFYNLTLEGYYSVFPTGEYKVTFQLFDAVDKNIYTITYYSILETLIKLLVVAIFMIAYVVDISTAIETTQSNRIDPKRTYVKKSNIATLKSTSNDDDIVLPDNIHVSAESRFNPLPSVLNTILKQESSNNNSAVTQLAQDVKCNDTNKTEYSSWLTKVYITLRNAGLLPFNPQSIPLEIPAEILQETPQQIMNQEITKRPKVSEIDYSAEECPDKKPSSNTSIEWIKKFYNKLKNANLLPSKENDESNETSSPLITSTTASSTNNGEDDEEEATTKAAEEKATQPDNAARAKKNKDAQDAEIERRAKEAKEKAEKHAAKDKAKEAKEEADRKAEEAHDANKEADKAQRVKEKAEREKAQKAKLESMKKEFEKESSDDSSSASDEIIAELVKSIESNSSSEESMEKTTAMNELLSLPSKSDVIPDSPFVAGNPLLQVILDDDWLSFVYDNLLGIGLVPDASPQGIVTNNTKIITKASFI